MGVMLFITVISYLINIKIGTIFLWLIIVKILCLNKGNWKKKMIQGIVYSSPFYYFSFFGTNDRLSLCTLLCFFLSVGLLIEHFSIKKYITKKSLKMIFLWIVFVCSYFLSVIQTANPFVTISESYQLVILSFVIIAISIYNRSILSEKELDLNLELFIKGIVALSLGIYVQFLVSNFMGVEIGHIFRYGNRVVFNLFFYAKSVLSLYLSLGLLYFYIEFFKKKKLTSLLLFALILGAILMNNSRTGIICMLAIATIYTFFHYKDVIRSAKITSALLLFVLTVSFVIQYMISIRSGLSDIMDDNGRTDLIIKAIILLPNYIFSGIGGSGLDYLTSNLGMVIHNFAIAYLIQFGCLGGFSINYILLSSVWHYKSEWSYYLMILILGGMMFANWQNCVYIFPIYILCALKSRQREKINE